MAKLTPKQKNEKRLEIYEIIKAHFAEIGEDIEYCVKGDTKTAILNMPTVIDGEDAWAEIMVSIPKEEYDGYTKREDFEIAAKAKAEKAKADAEKKAKKIEKDKKLREKKAKEKEE